VLGLQITATEFSCFRIRQLLYEVSILAVQSKTFESYGARVSISSSSTELIEKAVSAARNAVLGNCSITEDPDLKVASDFLFEKEADGQFVFFQDGKLWYRSESEYLLFKSFDAMLRLAVAENAVDTVFLHAGVVGWKGKAVVFPGTSQIGKSTLVAELIRNGSEYFSDEYAVFDQEGFVHPFARDLSIRDWEPGRFVTAVSPSYFGADIREAKAQTGAVLFLKFAEGSEWKPETMSLGQGILEALPHALPLHSNTKLSMEVLKKGFENAIIAKSYRCDARIASREILDFLDKCMN